MASPHATRRGLAAASGLSLSAVAWLLTEGSALARRPATAQADLTPGFRLNLDLTDVSQLYMFLYGVWEPSQTALVQRILVSGRRFIDVGAHVGYYTLLAASQGAQVSAFEPDPVMASRIKANVALNGLEALVDVKEVAVAADSDGRTLYRGPRHNRGLTSTSAKWNLKDIGRVESASLADLLTPESLRSAQILKIDVEGSEPSVLKGFDAAASSLPDDAVVLLELSPRWWRTSASVDEVLRPLRESGFRLWTIENSYSPMRYLTPSRVFAPRPVTEPLSAKQRRYDLVLAKEESSLGPRR